MSIPAAWYADPADARNVRYWNGEKWTDLVAPMTTPIASGANQYATGGTAAIGSGATDYGAGAYTAGDYSGSSYSPGNYAPGGYGGGYGSGGYGQSAPQTGSFGADSYGSSSYGSGGYSAMERSPAYSAASSSSYSSGGGGLSSLASIGGNIWGIILGLIFIGGAVVTLQIIESANAAAPGSVIASGTVSKINMDGKYCSPEVDFIADGAAYVVQSSLAISPCPWHIGQSAKVSYVPGQVESTANVTDSAGTGPITIGKYSSIAIGAAIILRNGYSIYRRRSGV
jgi:hypothetical protein